MRLGYGRSSTFLHSEGDSAKQARCPKPKIVQDEIDFLKNWITNIKDRQRKVELAS